MNWGTLGDRSFGCQRWLRSSDEIKWKDKARLATAFTTDRSVFVVLITGNEEAAAESFCSGTAAHRARRGRSPRLLCWIGVWNTTRRRLITHLLFGTSVPRNSPPAHWRLTLLAKMRQITTACFKAHSCSKLLLNAAQFGLSGQAEPNYRKPLFWCTAGKGNLKKSVRRSLPRYVAASCHWRHFCCTACCGHGGTILFHFFLTLGLQREKRQ